MDYKEYNDYELLNFIGENNDEANEILFKKYQPIITKISQRMLRHCQNRGLELNDLIQEGMIALDFAIKTFDDAKETSFNTYAITCIKRRLISEVIATSRLKHKILNESVSLEYKTEKNPFVNIEQLLADESYNPEQVLVNYELHKNLIEQMRYVLTENELQVFELKINDFTYREIAEILDRDPKNIDNAIQRIKAKIKKVLKDEN